MIKTLLIISTLFVLSGCVSTHGVSTQYYSDCKEYYDLQGYYHKDCDDDMFTYKGFWEGVIKVFTTDDSSNKNVW